MARTPDAPPHEPSRAADAPRAESSRPTPPPPARTPLHHTLPGQAFLVFAVALILRLLHFTFTAASPLSLVPTSDEAEHWSLAAELAAGDWLGARHGVYFRPQLFAYVLALLMKLTGAATAPIHLAIAAMDAAAVACAAGLARLAFTRRAAIWGALACATYWPFVHFSGTFYMESFALLLQAAMLLTAAAAVRGLWTLYSTSSRGADGGPARAGEVPREHRAGFPPALLWSGALAGLLLLTRPTAAIALPAIALALAIATHRSTRSWRTAALAPLVWAALLLLVLLPNAVRNYKVSGQWILYSTNGPIAFYFANNAEGVSWETCSPGIEWELLISQPGDEFGVPENRLARYAWWKQRSLEYVREHPGHFLRGLYEKTLLVLNRATLHCTNNFAAMAELSPVQRWLPGFGFWGSLAIAGAALWMVRLRYTILTIYSLYNRNAACDSRLLLQAMLLAYAVLYLAGVALFLAVERHRLLALQPLFLFAGVWGGEWAAELAARRIRAALLALAAPLAALILTSLPLVGPETRAHERYWTQVNLALAHMELARTAPNPAQYATHAQAARAALETAEHTRPRRLEPLRLQVELAAKSVPPDPARALAIHVRFWNLLNQEYPRSVRVRAEQAAHGVHLALQANRADVAVEYARDLIAILPANADAHMLAGVAFMSAGLTEEAKTAFGITLKLNPLNFAANENLKRLTAKSGS